MNTLLLLAGAALLAGCADGAIPPSRSMNDPSNPAAPEAPLASAAGFAVSSSSAAAAPPSPPHDMGAMKHDHAAMLDGGRP
jgi:uncharacterized lipoprotein YajG